MKKFFTDFKNFIAKGNIMDLAIAVIIGGAFGKIVTSLVNDIIMPLITLALGKVSIADLKWGVVSYGLFLQSILDFLIIAIFIFVALKIVMSIKNNFEKLEHEMHRMSDDKRKAFVKELKAQGKKSKEIKLAVKERDELLIQQAKEEQERIKKEEEALKPETSEQILSEIRELLKAQQESNKTKS